jgi:LuxR family transcriptional regulator, maltose regulon positive regulatory protein
LRGLVTMNLAVAHLLVGDFNEARRAGDEALRVGHETGNRSLLYFAHFSQAGIERMLSHLPRAADALRKALEAAQMQGGAGYLPIATLAHRYLAEILYEWNDMESAYRHITLAVELGQSWWVRDEMIKSYMLLARIQKARDNNDAVGNALKQAEDLTEDRYTFNLLTQVGLPSLKQWLADGCLHRVVHWGERELKAFTSEPVVTIQQSSARANLARLSLVQDNPDLALELLKPLLQIAEKKQITFLMIEVLVLQALALQACDDIPGALDCLNRALSLARPGNLVRTFLDEGEAMQSLLHRVTGANRRYASTLVYVLDARGNPSASAKEQTEISDGAAGTLIEPLSRRELEVMPLLAEGLSNLELARKLHISMDTVKVHLRHIYQKLGVNNRSQATSRARELSLL